MPHRSCRCIQSGIASRLPCSQRNPRWHSSPSRAQRQSVARAPSASGIAKSADYISGCLSPPGAFAQVVVSVGAARITHLGPQVFAPVAWVRDIGVAESKILLGLGVVGGLVT